VGSFYSEEAVMGHNRAGDRVKAKERRIKRLDRKAAKTAAAAEKGSGVGGAVKAAVGKVKKLVGLK
jgi:hypothetical protein